MHLKNLLIKINDFGVKMKTSYICIISYIIMFGSFLFFPIYKKQILAKMGNCIHKKTKKKSPLSLIIYVLCFVIVLLELFRKLSLSMNLMISGCAILGVFIITKEIVLYSLNGIYQNGVICNSEVVYYSDIMSFPVLQLPKNEQANYDSSFLVVSIGRKDNINLCYKDEDECKSVLDAMLSICPSLQKLLN
jgi:hypothetical protein